MLLKLGSQLFCLLTNPDHIAEVFRDRLLFTKAQDLHSLYRLLGNGLLTSEGDFWQRQQRLTQPVFHHQRIQDHGMAPSWWTIPNGCSKPGQEDHGQEIDRHYQDAIAQLDETIYAMIDHRRETKGDDLLSLLMRVQDAEDGSRMSDRQLRDEVATLLLAGHETTANTLS